MGWCGKKKRVRTIVIPQGMMNTNENNVIELLPDVDSEANILITRPYNAYLDQSASFQGYSTFYATPYYSGMNGAYYDQPGQPRPKGSGYGGYGCIYSSPFEVRRYVPNVEPSHRSYPYMYANPYGPAMASHYTYDMDRDPFGNFNRTPYLLPMDMSPCSVRPAPAAHLNRSTPVDGQVRLSASAARVASACPAHSTAYGTPSRFPSTTNNNSTEIDGENNECTR